MDQQHWSLWMRESQAGNREAYGRLLHGIRPWLTRYYRNRVPTDSVDDLVQDTLLTVHNKRHTYDPAYPFGPWLAAVARHRLIDWVRKNKRSLEVPMADDFDPGAMPPDMIETDHDLDYFMKTMTDDQREAVRLIKLEQLSYEEAAMRTGLSVPTLKVQVHRGIKKMTEQALREAPQL